MSERSFDELSNLTEVAGLCYSPIANDALRRVTSQMLEEAENENADNTAEQVPNNDNEPSIENEQSTSTPVVPKKKTKSSRRKFRYMQKLALKGKRPKQDRLKACLICSRNYANMRQHLTKTHQLSKKHHNFLLSFHRTQNCTSTVYQCNTCCVRFTGKKKHKKSCKNPQIIRVRADSKDEFPIDIKDYVPTPSGNISQVHRLLAEYDENRSDSGDQPLTRFQKNFLIKAVDVTKHFRKPMHLKIVFNQVKSEKNYTFQTMRKFLFELSRLIEYCKCYKQKEYRFNPGLITGELRTLLRNTAKKSAKEVNSRMMTADDDPPKPMPEVEDNQEEVQEQVDGGEDENEERCNEVIHDRDAVTPDADEKNRTEDSDKENSASDTLSLTNDDSFPDVDEYEPPKKAKKKNPPKEEPVDALAEKAKRWSEIRVKLLKFKGPDDPLRNQLILLFRQVCDRMRYIPRGELKQLAQAQGASERSQHFG